MRRLCSRGGVKAVLRKSSVSAGPRGGKKENFSIYKQNSDEKIGVFRAAQRAKKIDFMAKMQYNIIMYQNGYVCIFLNIL